VFGQRFSDGMYQLLQKTGINTFVTVFALLGGICNLLSLIGFFQILGLGGVTGLPAMFFSYGLFNVELLKRSFRSFTVISMTLLNAFIFAIWLDAYQFEPDRVIAVVCSYLVIQTTIMSDCRAFAKKRNTWRGMQFVLASAFSWVLIILWYSGAWINVHQRILIIGPNSIDLMSTAMGSFVTLTILITRVAYASMFASS